MTLEQKIEMLEKRILELESKIDKVAINHYHYNQPVVVQPNFSPPFPPWVVTS